MKKLKARENIGKWQAARMHVYRGVAYLVTSLEPVKGHVLQQLQGDRSTRRSHATLCDLETFPKHGLWEGHITAQLTRCGSALCSPCEARQSGRLL